MLKPIFLRYIYEGFIFSEQKTIRKGKDEEDVATAAVIEIQRVWRGYTTRYGICFMFVQCTVSELNRDSS